jgi:hypothetical protein
MHLGEYRSRAFPAAPVFNREFERLIIRPDLLPAYACSTCSSGCSCLCLWFSTSSSKHTARIPKGRAGLSYTRLCRASQSPWPSSVSLRFPAHPCVHHANLVLVLCLTHSHPVLADDYIPIRKRREARRVPSTSTHQPRLLPPHPPNWCLFHHLQQAHTQCSSFRLCSRKDGSSYRHLVIRTSARRHRRLSSGQEVRGQREEVLQVSPVVGLPVAAFGSGHRASGRSLLGLDGERA